MLLVCCEGFFVFVVFFFVLIMNGCLLWRWSSGFVLYSVNMMCPIN